MKDSVTAPELESVTQTGLLLVTRLASLEGRRSDWIPPVEHRMRAEVSKWLSSCEETVRRVFGGKSSQVNTWQASMGRIVKHTRTSDDFRFRDGAWDEVGALVAWINQSVEILATIGTHHSANQPVAPDELLEVEKGVLHVLLPGLQGYKKTIEAQLQRFPYQRNVFIMIKYRDANAKLRRFLVDAKNSQRWSNYRMVIANDPDWNITGTIQNFMACLYCCKYGIAIFDEPERRQIFSPNVGYELGVMQYQSKPCLVLMSSEVSPEDIFFDLRFTLYKTYESELHAVELVEQWIRTLLRKPKKNKK